MYGDFYYEDDEDGLIVGANYYYELKKKKEEDEFDYTKLNRATSEMEYSEMLKQAEREYLTQTIFDRKILGKRWRKIGRRNHDKNGTGSVYRMGWTSRSQCL
jgi:hypothetical protein